jgi:hypothetical protein
VARLHRIFWDFSLAPQTMFKGVKIMQIMLSFMCILPVDVIGGEQVNARRVGEPKGDRKGPRRSTLPLPPLQ